jgi:hypothetical protein
VKKWQVRVTLFISTFQPVDRLFSLTHAGGLEPAAPAAGVNVAKSFTGRTASPQRAQWRSGKTRCVTCICHV